MSFNTFSSCSALDSFLCLSFLFGRLLFVFCVFCVSSSELSLSVELSLSSELSSSDELDSSSSELSSFLFLFLCGGCGFFVGFVLLILVMVIRRDVIQNVLDLIRCSPLFLVPFRSLTNYLFIVGSNVIQHILELLCLGQFPLFILPVWSFVVCFFVFSVFFVFFVCLRPSYPC